MEWYDAVEQLKSHVVKIETPNGHGTGFLCALSREAEVYGIATARHVIEHADKWQLPIRMNHPGSDTPELYKFDDRIIMMDPSGKDSAVILIGKRSLHFPSGTIELLPADDSLRVGSEVGWIGYPASFGLCFFSGRISGSMGAFGSHDHAYLIDGVAINGVSGGPVIVTNGSQDIHIIGSITHYRPNRASGETLPGLSIAQDVTNLHSTVNAIKSYDEAQRLANESKSDTDPDPGRSQ